jgi:hypothetical protein
LTRAGARSACCTTYASRSRFDQAFHLALAGLHDNGRLWGWGAPDSEHAERLVAVTAASHHHGLTQGIVAVARMRHDRLVRYSGLIR